jgi:hypothetical protein
VKTALLKKTADAIVDHADRFNMIYIGVPIDEARRGVLGNPACRTQACIVGEALLVSGKAKIGPYGGIVLHKPSDDSLIYIAQDLLRLTKPQMHRLFYLHSENAGAAGWPTQFEEAYKAALTALDRAQVAKDRILHFIKTRGRE